MKGFIINNDEVEEEEDEEGGESGEEDEEGKRKRDDDDDIDDRLEDDDFDLIEENLGIKVNRKVSNLCVCVRVCVCVEQFCKVGLISVLSPLLYRCKTVMCLVKVLYSNHTAGLVCNFYCNFLFLFVLCRGLINFEM